MEQEIDIAFFKNMLIEQFNELLNQGDNTVTSMKDEEYYFPDPTDRASVDELLNMKCRIRDRESKLIKKILDALDRIEAGDFGICEMCGEQISEGRLKARPVTTLCIECKTKSENMEKKIGV